MKNEYPLLLVISLLFAITSQGQATDTASRQKTAFRERYAWFSFQWIGDTVSNQYFDKALMVVPVQLNDLKGNNIAQFDLGSNATILYGNTIQNYFGSRAALLALTDTSTKETNESGMVVYQTKGLSITLGKTVYRKPILYDRFGDDNPKDSLYTSSSKLVGTIGADIMKDKVLIIDYPHQTMCIIDSLDQFWAAQTSFVQARIHNSRIHIPITIDGQTYWFLFDTGASIFPLSTDSLTWRKMVGSISPKDSLLIDTWGTKALVYGAFGNHDTYLGGLKLAKGEVWYSHFKPWLDIYRGAQVSGLVGNAFFFNDIIVIDFKHGQFGVVRQ